MCTLWHLYFFYSRQGNGTILLRIKSGGDLYPIFSPSTCAFFTLHQTANVWHRRLGHTSSRILDLFHSNKSIVRTDKFCKDCVPCSLGKSTRLSFTEVEQYSKIPLFLIHTDLWQSPVYSNHGHKYFILFVDDYSRYSWLYPMKFKSDILRIFIQFQKFVENLFHTKIVYFQRGGGKEYGNTPFLDFLLT